MRSLQAFRGCAWLTLVLLCANVYGYDERCPRGLAFTVRPFSGHCFQFVEEEKFWEEARDYCSWHGGKLVKIGNWQTSKFIKNTLRALRWYKNGVWIGLHDTHREMFWHWVTQDAGRHEPLRWSDWGRGHPGAFLHSFRDCVRMVRRDDWRWHESPCHLLKFHYRFICEYDMLPTTTSTTTKVTTTTHAPFVVRHFAVDKNKLPVAHGERKMIVVTTKEPNQTTTLNNEIAVFPGAVVDSLASKQLEDRQNPAILPWIIVCSVLALVVFTLIFLLFLRRRRRSGKDIGATARFDNVVYERGDSKQCHCNDETDSLVDECAVEISGLQRSKRVENEYVVHEFDKTTENKKLIKVPGVAALNESDSESENVSDSTRLMKRPLPEEPYEVPVGLARQTSNETGCLDRESADEGKDGMGLCGVVYDAPKPANVYAEIPANEEFGNIYETLDNIRDQVDRHYANM